MAIAIEWAARSEALTGRATIPIFWLQSEDHDAKEIATAHILDKDQVTKVTMSMSGHERTSVAHRTLTSEMTAVFDKLSQAWHNTPFGDETIEAARSAWAPERRVVDAFAETLYQWLGELGLVILDPRDPDLAALTQSLHERAIFDAELIEETLNAQSDRLVDLGFRAPITPRPRGTLSFFHPDGPEGPRYRLMRADHGFELSGRSQTFSVTELRTILNTHPECFSTSALLRPVLQERWLPTVATVVGPGELSYFSQLPPLFARFGHRHPGVIPRARARLWTASWRRAFRKGEFTEADLVDLRDDVLTRVGRAHLNPIAEQVRVQALEAPLAAIDQLIAEAEHLDRGVAEHAQRTRRTLEKSVTGLLDRYARTTARRFDQHLDRLDRLRAGLAPHRTPQERILSPLHFAATFGADRLVETLNNTLNADAAGRLTEVELW